MSKSFSKKGISIKDKLESFSLSFDLKEFQESLEKNIINNPASSVFSNNKRAWFGEVVPEVVSQIDSQLRKRYSIGENKMVACLYYPPEKEDNGKMSEKSLKISENRQNVMTRFVISSIHEVCNISFGGSSPESIEMRAWVSYKVPDMIGGMLSYEFKNDRNLNIPAKKGFRQVRKMKALDKRHILVLDYLISKNQYKELEEMLGKKIENSERVIEEDENVDDAINELM